MLHGDSWPVNPWADFLEKNQNDSHLRLGRGKRWITSPLARPPHMRCTDRLPLFSAVFAAKFKRSLEKSNVPGVVQTSESALGGTPCPNALWRVAGGLSSSSATLAHSLLWGVTFSADFKAGNLMVVAKPLFSIKGEFFK